MNINYWITNKYEYKIYTKTQQHLLQVKNFLYHETHPQQTHIYSLGIEAIVMNVNVRVGE
jgi:hypothetical protein